jgi:hypothetical protein
MTTDRDSARGICTRPPLSPWRRYLRFSVRGLIVVVLVFGGWLGWTVRSARIQREAVAAITNARGHVTYDWRWSKGKSIPGGKPWAPSWPVDLMGVDYFAHVTLVVVSGATDAELVQVGRLTRVQSLSLHGSCITDAGLSHLNGLHAGGLHALFADGASRFMKSTIDPNTLLSILTINGGEVIGRG